MAIGVGSLFKLIVMSYRDLQALKNRIQALGENIREQENFYGNINEFLHQVYQPQQKSTARRPHMVPAKLTRTLNDYR